MGLTFQWYMGLATGLELGIAAAIVFYRLRHGPAMPNGER